MPGNLHSQMREMDLEDSINSSRARRFCPPVCGCGAPHSINERPSDAISEAKHDINCYVILCDRIDFSLVVFK
jgi:hypothetical protein